MPWMDNGNGPEWVDEQNLSGAQRGQLGMAQAQPNAGVRQMVSTQVSPNPSSSPFLNDPTGTGPNQGDLSSPDYGQPITTHYNQNLFGTDQTAQGIAKQYGGSVISGPLMEAGGGTPGSPFTMPNANYIKLQNGGIVNAGQIAQWQQLGRQDLIDNEFKNAFGSTANPAGATGASEWFKQYDPQGLNGVKGAPGATLNTGATAGAGAGAVPSAGAGGNRVTPRTPANTGARQVAMGKTLPRGTTVGTGDLTAPSTLHQNPGGGGVGVSGGGRSGIGTVPRTGVTGSPDPSIPGTIPPPPGSGARPGGGGVTNPPSITRPPQPGGTVTPPPGGNGGGGVGAPRPPGGTGGTITQPPPVSGPPQPGTSPTGADPISSTSGINSRLQAGGYIDSAGLRGWSGGTGAIGGAPTSFNWRPGTTPGDILANDREFAYGQGQNLIENYGQGLADENQRARSLASVGDSLYAWMLNNPGYTPEQAQQIMNQQGLDGLDWTGDMANSNFLTEGEQSGIAGDPYAARDTYGSQVEGLRTSARNFGGSLNGIYDNGATNLNSATGDMSQRLDNSIDGSKLGLSGDYESQHHFGPEDQQAIIEDAGRTVGQGTAAQMDQIARQSAAAGTNAPLATAAAMDRARQTGAVASADAMTKARIQAKQLGLDTSQQTENTRLGSEQDLSTRRMGAATTAGQANIGNQQFLTSGRAGAGLQTGQAQLNQENMMAEKQTDLTGSAEMQKQQRAQAMAQNRQQVNQANQASQFQRGSYTDQAKSQRATQIAGAERNDLTQGRQDVRNEETTGLNEQNSLMAGQLQAFGNVTGAGQSSEANAIRAAQLPTTLDKVVGGLSGATQAFAHGGIVDKPTVARLGEAGPEITIKLKPSNGGPMQYRRRNEVAYAA